MNIETDVLDINDVVKDQDRIDKMVIFKLKRQENTFVHFVEIDRDTYME